MNRVWDSRLRRVGCASQVIKRTHYFRFYDAHKPVGAIQVINPTVVKPTHLNTTNSYFANEPIVTEATALEEVLLTRLRDQKRLNIKKTPEQREEFKIIRRIDTQRLKQNTHLVHDRIKTIFDDMRITNFTPTVRIYYKAVNALVKCNRTDKAHEMYAEMKSKFSSDHIPGGLMAYMIGACVPENDHERATQYMQDMLQAYESPSMSQSDTRHHNLQTAFNHLLQLHANMKKVDRLEQVVALMGQHAITPSDRTFYYQVLAHSLLQQFDRAQFIIENMPDAVGRDADGYLTNEFSIMLMNACTSDQVETCQQIFDEIPHKDAMCYEALMRARMHAGQYDRTYEIYERMKSDKVKAKQQVIATLLDACYHDGLDGVPTVENNFIESVKKKFYGVSYLAPQHDFDMHRIRRYWRETKSVWNWRDRHACVRDALRRILDKRQQVKDDTKKVRIDNKATRRDQFATMLSTRRRQEEIEKERSTLQKTLDRLSKNKN